MINLLNNYNTQIYKNFAPQKKGVTVSIPQKSVTADNERRTKNKRKKFVIYTGIVGGYIILPMLLAYSDRKIKPALVTTSLFTGIYSGYCSVKSYIKNKREHKINNSIQRSLALGIILSATLLGLSVGYSKSSLKHLEYELTGMLDKHITRLNPLKALLENIKNTPISLKASFDELTAYTKNTFAVHVRKPKSKTVLKLQNELKKELGLGKIYLGENEDYAGWLCDFLREIDKRKIVDMQKLNIISDFNRCSKTSAASYLKSNNLMEISLENVEELFKMTKSPNLEQNYLHGAYITFAETVLHELGHMHHSKTVSKVWRMLDNQNKNDIFPLILPKNVRGINVKHEMENYVREVLNSIIGKYDQSNKRLDNYYKEYTENKYLKEMFARIFAAKNLRFSDEFSKKYFAKLNEEKLYGLSTVDFFISYLNIARRYCDRKEAQTEKIMEALLKNDPLEMTEKFFKITFNQIKYEKDDLWHREDVDKFWNEVLPEIKRLNSSIK